MVKRYKKKIEDVEAIQWTGDNEEEIVDYLKKKDICWKVIISDAKPPRLLQLYNEKINHVISVLVNQYLIFTLENNFIDVLNPYLFHAIYEEKEE